MKDVILVTAILGFGRSVRIFLADSQGFHRFMATDLEHEDMVETAVFGPENNLIVTGSRDALIQVRGRCLPHFPTSTSGIESMILLGYFGFKIQTPIRTSAGKIGLIIGEMVGRGESPGTQRPRGIGITKICNKGYRIPTKLSILGRLEQSWGEGRKIPVNLKVLTTGEKST